MRAPEYNEPDSDPNQFIKLPRKYQGHTDSGTPRDDNCWEYSNGREHFDVNARSDLAVSHERKELTLRVSKVNAFGE